MLIINIILIITIMKGNKMLNKVNKNECINAIDYFWECVDLDNERDITHYTKILLKKVANDYNIKLEGL